MKIRELYTDASKWTQTFAARDINGRPVETDSPNATCFCLIGALMKCDGIKLRTADSLTAFLRDSPSYQKIKEKVGGSILHWNDQSGRTFAEVKALVEELDV